MHYSRIVRPVNLTPRGTSSLLTEPGKHPVTGQELRQQAAIESLMNDDSNDRAHCLNVARLTRNSLTVADADFSRLDQVSHQRAVTAFANADWLDNLWLDRIGSLSRSIMN